MFKQSYRVSLCMGLGAARGPFFSLSGRLRFGLGAVVNADQISARTFSLDIDT